MSTPNRTRKNEHPAPVPRLIVLMKAARGYHVVDVRTVLYAQADSRFCRISFTDGTEKAVFHTLTEMEGILCCGERMGDLLFVRVHKSHIIGFHHLTSLGTDRSVMLAHGERLSVGRQYWNGLLAVGMCVGSAGTGVEGGLMSLG
jgi:DNA-binding LytR/AlgR family response regulator